MWSADGRRAYASAGGNTELRVYELVDGRLSERTSLALPTSNPAGITINAFPAGLALSADGTRLYVRNQMADALTVIDVATGSG